ncbi:uncharacterized protein LOC127131292 [Lathyrus oleraceus]|uniref:uncharacterized protein LOC127131292 n=1 Tax=Pisum sativum TaxID=3888 RepID=UPI0021D38391|nr:uncharacterized protein LOC127131292 [Pisum sativum]
MSSSKFLKEVLSNKRKLEDHEIVALTLYSSVVIKNMVIPKLKDLESFFIPYQIGNMTFKMALCNLGTNVSLVPLSVCKKLDMGDMKLRNVFLQLEDRLIKYHVVVLEDVLVKVGDYYVHVDFVIIVIDEDSQISVLLGRYFLATAGATIDVKRGKLTFERAHQEPRQRLKQVLDYMELEADRYASLSFLASAGRADTTDVEQSAIGMVADVESVVDTEEVLEL